MALDFQGQGLEANVKDLSAEAKATAKDLTAEAKATASVLQDPRGQGHISAYD